MRVDNGTTLASDGPYVDPKGAVGGYFVLEADDIDAAIESLHASRPHGTAAPSRCVPSRPTGDPALGRGPGSR